MSVCVTVSGRTNEAPVEAAARLPAVTDVALPVMRMDA